jgi:hypothetical protein
MWQLKTARILRDQSLRRNGDRPADMAKIFPHYSSGRCLSTRCFHLYCFRIDNRIVRMVCGIIVEARHVEIEPLSQICRTL